MIIDYLIYFVACDIFYVHNLANVPKRDKFSVGIVFSRNETPYLVFCPLRSK